MPILANWLLVLAALASLLAGAAAGAASTSVSFPSLDGQTRLEGHLSLPDTAPPYAAVVFLHGCSGLGRDGRVFSTYRAWARHLNEASYAVLMVDSAAPRGIGTSCGRRAIRRVLYRDRPKDAYGALAYLQSLPSIQADRIALIGWSQGGGIVLLTIVSQSIGRPSPPPRHDFRAAVAFYPGACSERLQSTPFTDVAPGTWSTAVPLLVLQGGADNWTKAAPCRDFIAAARARNEPVSITLYPDAHHSFDAPDMPLHRRRGVKTRSGEAPLVGTDEAARLDALRAVPAFLKRQMTRD